MLQNKKTILLFSSTVILITVVLFFLFYFFFRPHTIYCVNNVMLFDGFKMTQEMKKQGESLFNSKKQTLDSLYTELQREDLSAAAKELMTQDFIAKREDFDGFTQNYAQQETQKIWSRIQQYTKDYAQEKGCKMIVGSAGSSDVLFADKSLDITSDLLFYINQKYEGH